MEKFKAKIVEIIYCLNDRRKITDSLFLETETFFLPFIPTIKTNVYYGENFPDFDDDKYGTNDSEVIYNVHKEIFELRITRMIPDYTLQDAYYDYNGSSILKVVMSDYLAKKIKEWEKDLNP